MANIITGKIGVRVAVIVNFFLLVVIAIGTYVLIDKQTLRLQEELLSKGQNQSILGAKMIG
ncbi:MAG: hypothetical protein GY699_15615, partial [Desulfobacteraceae bacterium]|nr:hypothetical protein [Desulfobacteraceae bacterium]